MSDEYLSQFGTNPNLVQSCHLQLQYWSMYTQKEQAVGLGRAEFLQEPLHEKNQQLGDPAISSPIMIRDVESSQALLAIKSFGKPTNSLPSDSLQYSCSSQDGRGNKKSQQGIQLNEYSQQIEVKNKHEHKIDFKQNSPGNKNLENKTQKGLESQKIQGQGFYHLGYLSKISTKNRKKIQKQKNNQNDDYSSQLSPQPFVFPFDNKYLSEHKNLYLKTLQGFEKAKNELKKTMNDTFSNCDVRYFNWKLFAQKVGSFDVVLIDPPWRIKGAQQNDSQFMFANSRFSLEYNTMANSEIRRIPLHILSDQGFIFLWILNSQLDASLQIMEEWGYQLVEEIIWVKLKDEKISLTHGYYFMHSYEVCLVGYKCKKQTKEKKTQLKLRQGLSWNAIFSEVRHKSQKPEDLYSLIDMMFKGGKKIQIFARNHNLRFGIFSLGNELGQSYDKWQLRLSCDQCGTKLTSGKRRFKSKIKPNYDLCQRCVQIQDKTQFFQLCNDVDQNIKHQFISCDHCGIQPLWGIRFQCVTCKNFDICQNCFDKNLHPQNNFHPLDHEISPLQVPLYGNGFNIHETKCTSCYQNPIIGIYFNCLTCRNFNLCQKCYFERPTNSSSSLMKRHKPEHQLQAIFESQIPDDKKYECFGCKRQVLENCWMCQNCYNFFFCQNCYQKRSQFKSMFATTHKKYHVLAKIF